MWSLAISSQPPQRAASKADEQLPSVPLRGNRPPLDETAFERLHARTSRALWGYLRRLTGDPAVADDVHQATYLRFLERPPGGGRTADAGPGDDERRQAAYLFRIATNLVHDRWRRQKRERGWLEQLGVEPPSRRAPLSIDFETVFGQLEPRQRALLWLAYVEGYRHLEIAEILGLKERSIRVLLFRARRHLAKLLRQHGLEPESAPLEEVTP